MSRSVSVIIPSYNCGAYLAEAIDSVLEQTHPAREVIVVDDGSTDDTASVIRGFGRRITCLRQSNQGVSAARNAGARIAKGDWLMFLDADDRLLPEALRKLTGHGAGRDVGVVFGLALEWRPAENTRIAKGDGRCAGAPPRPAKENFWRVAIYGPGAAIVRRSLHESIAGFDPAFQNAEDRDYWLRCGLRSSFVFSGNPVYEKRLRPGSAIANVERAIIQGMLVQSKFLRLCEKEGVDTGFLEAGREDIAERALRRAVKGRCPGAVGKVFDYCRQEDIRCRYRFRAWIWRFLQSSLGR